MNAKPVAKQTPEAFIAAVDEDRREDVARLHALIRRTAPRLEPVVSGRFLGYGPFHYRYASGREGDTFRLSLAANKSYLSLYVLAADTRGYVAERYRERLPAADIGKSCVRFKRLEQLDEAVLVTMLKEAAQMPFPGKSGSPALAPAKKAATTKKAPSRKTPAAKQVVSKRASTRH